MRWLALTQSLFLATLFYVVGVSANVSPGEVVQLVEKGLKSLSSGLLEAEGHRVVDTQGAHAVAQQDFLPAEVAPSAAKGADETVTKLSVAEEEGKEGEDDKRGSALQQDEERKTPLVNSTAEEGLADVDDSSSTQSSLALSDADATNMSTNGTKEVSPTPKLAKPTLAINDWTRSDKRRIINKNPYPFKKFQDLAKFCASSASEHVKPGHLASLRSQCKLWERIETRDTQTEEQDAVNGSQSPLRTPGRLGFLLDISRVPVSDAKYLNEDPLNSHADERWGSHLARLSVKFRNDMLKETFAAWAEFAELHDITYWLAHGTLLSWLWNENVFPWDEDGDIQTTNYELLAHIAALNGSVVHNRFYLDVNPNIIFPFHQTDNVIDARFIDTHSGVYLDITGLRMDQEGKLRCKSVHSYRPDDLFPLHRAIYSGVKTWRPHFVQKLLAQEYGIKALSNTEFAGYRFDTSVQDWIQVHTEGNVIDILKNITKEYYPANSDTGKQSTPAVYVDTSRRLESTTNENETKGSGHQGSVQRLRGQ